MITTFSTLITMTLELSTLNTMILETLLKIAYIMILSDQGNLLSNNRKVNKITNQWKKENLCNSVPTFLILYRRELQNQLAGKLRNFI